MGACVPVDVLSPVGASSSGREVAGCAA
jgi:hypothetical protein